MRSSQMTMNCRAYEELLDSHVDGELDEQQRREAEAHVAACSHCTSMRLANEQARGLVRRQAPRHRVPEEVRKRIAERLDEDARSSQPDRSHPRLTRYIIGGAIAATFALMVSSLFQTSRPELLATLVEDVHAVREQSMALAVRSDDTSALRQFYRTSGRFAFDDTVPNLSAAGIRPVGAGIGSVGGVDTTLTVYEATGSKVVCRRFPAGSLDLPPGGHRVGDATWFDVDDVTIRIQRFGPIVCALATDMPREAFARTLQLTGHDSAEHQSLAADLPLVSFAE
jgi:hypothetical protein